VTLQQSSIKRRLQQKWSVEVPMVKISVATLSNNIIS